MGLLDDLVPTPPPSPAPSPGPTVGGGGVGLLDDLTPQAPAAPAPRMTQQTGLLDDLVPTTPAATPAPQPQRLPPTRRPVGQPGEVLGDYVQTLKQAAPAALRSRVLAPITDFQDPRWQAAYTALRSNTARVPPSMDTFSDLAREAASPQIVKQYLQSMGIPVQLNLENDPGFTQKAATSVVTGAAAATPALGATIGHVGSFLGLPTDRFAQNAQDLADEQRQTGAQAGDYPIAERTTEMGENMIPALAAGPAAPAVMGVEAAGDEYQSLRDSGASPAKARALGTAYGLATGLLGKAGGADTRLAPAAEGGVIDNAMAEGAKQSAIMGAQGLAGAGTTALVDPEKAKQELQGIPESMIAGGLMGGIAGATRGHGVLADLVPPQQVPRDPSGRPMGLNVDVQKPVDPNAVTQEMPTLNEQDLATPPTRFVPHGDINTEPIKGPGAALAREQTPDDLQDHQAELGRAIDRLNAKKQILATGKPVIGADETQEMPAVDEDATRSGDTQDNVATQRANYRVFPDNDPLLQGTLSTQELTPEDRSAMTQGTQPLTPVDQAANALRAPPDPALEDWARRFLNGEATEQDAPNYPKTPSPTEAQPQGDENAQVTPQVRGNGRQEPTGPDGTSNHQSPGRADEGQGPAQASPRREAGRVPEVVAPPVNGEPLASTTIDHDHQVGYGGGSTADGKVAEVSKLIPPEFAPYVGLHESVEWVQRKAIAAKHPDWTTDQVYQAAHQLATKAEHARVKADIVSGKAPWKDVADYESTLAPHLEAARRGAQQHPDQVDPKLDGSIYEGGKDGQMLNPDRRPPVRGGQAPGERPNARPDLAIPTKDPAVRDMYKQVDAQRGKPPVKAQATSRAEGEELLKSPSQRAALEDKARQGHPLTDGETHALQRMVEQAYQSGDIDRATHLMSIYRNSRANAARAFGLGYDPSETPAQRAKTAARAIVLEPSQATKGRAARARATGKEQVAKALEAKTAEQAKEVQRRARAAGIDPHTLESLPKAPKAKGRVAKAADAAVTASRQAALTADRMSRARKATLDARFADLKNKFGRLITGKDVSSNAWGTAHLDLLWEMAVNRAEAGLHKFAGMALAVAKLDPGARRDSRKQAQLEDIWNRVASEHPEYGLDRAGSGDADTAIHGTIDDRLEAAKQRAQQLADKVLANHAEAMAMSPEDRLQHLQDLAKRKQVDQTIRDAVASSAAERKALTKQVANRDRALVLNHDRLLKINLQVKGDAWDAAYEWTRSAMHTALPLFAKKGASDLATGLIHFAAMRPIQELGARGVTALPAIMREQMAIMRAITPAFAEGLRNALSTWRSESSAFGEQVRGAQIDRSIETGEALPKNTHNEFDQHQITHPLFKHIRFNIRLTGAIQDLAETAFARMQVAAEAQKSAVDASGKRLEGDALEAHISKEMGDLTSQSWTKAIDTARDITGTKAQTVGPVAWLNKMKSGNPHDQETTAGYAWERAKKEAARYTFPFVSLPFNFLRNGVMMSPMGSAVMLAKLAGKAGGLDYGRDAIARDCARQLIGYTTMALIAPSVGSSITGYNPWSPQDADLQAPPAHSIRLNGKWHDYSGLGMFAHVLGTSCDIIQATHELEKGRGVGETLGSFASKFSDQITSESFLRSLKTISDACHSASGFQHYAASALTMAYPTMLKEIAKAPSDTQPESRVKPKGVMAGLAYQVERELGVSGAPPAVDVFGHDINPKGPGTDLGSILLRLANPFSGPQDTTGDQDLKSRILSYNQDHPDEPIMPNESSPTIKGEINGKKVTYQCTPQEYHDLLAQAGPIAATSLRRQLDAVPNGDLPTQVKAAMSVAHAVARNALLSKVRQAAK